MVIFILHHVFQVCSLLHGVCRFTGNIIIALQAAVSSWKHPLLNRESA